MGQHLPSTAEVTQVLEAVDGLCTDRKLEHKAVLECAAAQRTPFVLLTFKLPKQPGDTRVPLECEMWLKSAEHAGRRWIVADGLLLADGNSVRHRWIFELRPDGPELYFEVTDQGGPVMPAQSDEVVDAFHRPEALPKKLRAFFVSDPWQ